MPTPRLDRIAINFLHRVPDEFVTAFTPGTAMPEANILTKAQIVNYVNRALNQLFNDFWQTIAGDWKKFIRIFPELSRITPNQIVFTNGNYTVASPYLNIYKVVGGFIDATPKRFIKVWEEWKYSIAITEEYPEYVATSINPAIIQIHNLIALFPQATTNVKLQYIAAPIDPTTGAQLTQNGTYDSPFFDHWNDMITDIAYSLYLKETTETT